MKAKFIYEKFERKNANNRRWEFLQPKIKRWLDDNNILKYTITEDNKIDVHQDVFLKYDFLENIHFGNIEGDFQIWVFGKEIDFKKMNIDFIEGKFSINNIKTEDLSFLPFAHNFYLSGEFQSMHGLPEEIDGNLSIDSDNIKTLEGSPKIIHGNYSMQSTSLESFKGAPTIIDGNFSLGHNLPNTITLEGFPKIIKGNLHMSTEGIKFKKSDIEKVCDVRGEINLLSSKQEAKQKSNKKYLEKGPIKDRVTHKLHSESDYPEYSRGYILYHVLKFVEESGSEGRRFIELQKHKYEISFGENTWKGGKDNRGYGSNYFSKTLYYGKGGAIGRRTKHNNKNKYVLNSLGKEYLKKYKHSFDKKEH